MAGPVLRVVDDLTEAAEEIIVQAPRHLVLAGGRTPAAMYRRLARGSLAWSSMDVWFSDERCVPPDHQESNFRMAHEALLAHVPARVHRMPGETCDAQAYETELREAFGHGEPTAGSPALDLPALDLVVLGLGADGHTASLFPGDPVLDEREGWVAHAVHRGRSRLTLTLPLLSAARTALFLVAGEEKRPALDGLLAGDERLPAARVRADRVIVYADRAAAGPQPLGGAVPDAVRDPGDHGG